jgi:hypothetical protein
MAPSGAKKSILMVWRAFSDESERKDKDSDVFVIQGCISTADRWANFAREWEELLPPFGRSDSHGYYFHMTEMADLQQVAALYRLMGKISLCTFPHAIAGVI